MGRVKPHPHPLPPLKARQDLTPPRSSYLGVGTTGPSQRVCIGKPAPASLQPLSTGPGGACVWMPRAPEAAFWACPLGPSVAPLPLLCPDTKALGGSGAVQARALPGKAWVRSREGPVSLTGGGGGARCLPHTGPGHRPLLASTQEPRRTGEDCSDPRVGRALWAEPGKRLPLSPPPRLRGCGGHIRPKWQPQKALGSPQGLGLARHPELSYPNGQGLARPHIAWATPPSRSALDPPGLLSPPPPPPQKPRWGLRGPAVLWE